jgi:hypothetical protein
MLEDEQLSHEEEIVQGEDWSALGYVRQALDKLPRRKGRPQYARHGRMVGWANLGAEAEPDPDSGLFLRRVFYLLPHDRDSDPEGPYRVGAPGEAVDPETVAPGQVGRKTPRSQGKGAALSGS